MDPITAAAALRLIAQNIDLSPAPSLSDVTGELEQALRYIESGDIRTAGPIDWLKGLKKKVFKGKGEKKTLEKLERLENLIENCESVADGIRSGEDLAELASNEDFLQVFEGSVEFIKSGSEKLAELASDTAAIEYDLAELDEYWIDDGEDDEESDREIIVEAISEFSSKCEERLKKLKKKLQKQESERKKSKKKKPVGKKKKSPGAKEIADRFKGKGKEKAEKGDFDEGGPYDLDDEIPTEKNK